MVQRYTIHTGVRSLKVNRLGRIMLNGRQVDLKGAAIHEDSASRGAALIPAQMRQTFAYLHQLGAHITRTHCPLNPYELELADRYGILVWSEIPVFRMKSTLFNIKEVRDKALRMLREGPVTEKGTYEFQADFLRYRLDVIDSKPFINAAIVWNLRDFPGEAGLGGRKPDPVLDRLGVRRALVAGHSTGGEVAIALAARHPELARRLAIIDTEPDEKYVPSDTLADLSVTPVIGETMKRLATDGTIRDGLGQAFEKGFEVPDQFVKDFNKLTYTAYKDTDDESADYVDEGHFARDLRAVKVPKLVIFGKDDRLVKPAAAETYHREFGLPVRLVAGAGHSPMVEQPAETARLLLALERERSR